MSIKVIVSMLGKESDLGKVDSKNFTLNELVKKLRGVCGMKIELVDDVRLYVRLPGGNEVSEIRMDAELDGIITLFEELGEDTLCLRVERAINAQGSDEEELNDYIDYVKNRAANHMGDDHVKVGVNLGQNEQDNYFATGYTQRETNDDDDEGIKDGAKAFTYDVRADADDEADDEADDANILLNYQINSFDSEESIGVDSDGDLGDESGELWSGAGDNNGSVQESASSESEEDVSSRYWNSIKGGIRAANHVNNIMLLPPSVLKKMANADKNSRFLDIIDGPSPLFEVLEGSAHYVVNLDSKVCGCGAWQLFGYLCKHAMKVLNYMRMPSVDSVHYFLTQEYYLRTYAHRIIPIPDEPLWPKIDNIEQLHPPLVKRKAGRPKLRKRKGVDEVVGCSKKSVAIRCSACKQLGHNKRTCRLASCSSSIQEKTTYRHNNQVNGLNFLGKCFGDKDTLKSKQVFCMCSLVFEVFAVEMIFEVFTVQMVFKVFIVEMCVIDVASITSI
ncbi:Zinc finger, PMZ-type [Melia azedarach]|uniref:Zinc finger, PMZ-type n=1 Tax=Melia azedarach TaxID=155640 RepID=A0ACC1Z2U2_MELAZ|nr:Zinc finger, PMZ-type [Melia azedarach]